MSDIAALADIVTAKEAVWEYDYTNLGDCDETTVAYNNYYVAYTNWNLAVTLLGMNPIDILFAKSQVYGARVTQLAQEWEMALNAVPFNEAVFNALWQDLIVAYVVYEGVWEIYLAIVNNTDNSSALTALQSQYDDLNTQLTTAVAAYNADKTQANFDAVSAIYEQMSSVADSINSAIWAVPPAPPELPVSPDPPSQTTWPAPSTTVTYTPSSDPPDSSAPYPDTMPPPQPAVVDPAFDCTVIGTASFNVMQHLFGSGTATAAQMVALGSYNAGILSNWPSTQAFGHHQMYIDTCAHLAIVNGIPGVPSIPSATISAWNSATDAQVASILTTAYTYVYGFGPGDGSSGTALYWMMNADIPTYSSQFGSRAAGIGGTIGGACMALGAQQQANGAGSGPLNAAMAAVRAATPSGVPIVTLSYTSTDINQVVKGICRTTLSGTVLSNLVNMVNYGYIQLFGGSSGLNAPDISGLAVKGSPVPSLEGSCLNNYSGLTPSSSIPNYALVPSGVFGSTMPYPGAAVTVPGATIYSLANSLVPFGSTGDVKLLPGGATYMANALRSLYTSGFSVINAYANLGSTSLGSSNPLSSSRFSTQAIDVFVQDVYTAAFGSPPTLDTVTYFSNLYNTLKAGYPAPTYNDLAWKGMVLGYIQFYADTTPGPSQNACNAVLALMDQAAHGTGIWSTL